MRGALYRVRLDGIVFGLRASTLGEINAAIREYKSKKVRVGVRRTHLRTLWEHWSPRFGIIHNEDVRQDGALDSLVCATVAYPFHHAPATLYKLRHDVPAKTGCNPFYVVARVRCPERILLDVSWYARFVNASAPAERHNIDTAFGLRLDLDHPRPEDIRIEDVAGGLSKFCRFGAQPREYYSPEPNTPQRSVLLPK